MAKKENQRVLMTKHLLHEGLLQLLEIKDMDKISVTELCRVSGINRATFYNHYSSPKDLLSDMEGELIAGIDALMDYPKSQEHAVATLESICAFMKENSRSILILSRYHADCDLVESFHKLNNYFPPRKPRSRLTTAMDSDSVYLTVTFMYTGCYHLIREWLLKDIEKSPRQIAELLVQIISKDLCVC